MKALFLIFSLLISLSASAQVVFVNPILINMGNMVQVQLRNHTDFDLSCLGPVYLTTDTGRMEAASYFEWIPSQGFSLRSFYLSQYNERVVFSHHSIICQKR